MGLHGGDVDRQQNKHNWYAKIPCGRAKAMTHDVLLANYAHMQQDIATLRRSIKLVLTAALSKDAKGEGIMTALLTEHLATWIAADTAEKSARGRNKAASLYGD